VHRTELSEALVLTFPNESRFFALVRLVLSGLAAQLDLPIERIDDLQLAVEGALAGESPPGDEVTLRIEPRQEALSVWIRPIGVRADRAERAEGLGFDRIAAELVDSAEVVTVDGIDWLHLEKRVQASSGDSG
jgi:anti-sigma regulatory factor (Ser/Thr protein kinase)